MRIFRSFEEASGIRNPVVTTGSFDGVHVGHKTILARLKMLALKHHGESVLITFDPHPRKVLYPETAGKELRLINSQEEKLALLEKAGLNNVIIIEFTKEFSRITSEQFVRDFLYGILHAKVIVAGFNHHFGFNKEGDYRQLWEWQEKYNFEAEEIPEQEVAHETVSSTRIRQAISEGYIQRANAYLDHYYMIMGDLVNYSHKMAAGVPDLNEVVISDESKLLPSAGIYAVSAGTGDDYSKGMVIITNADDLKKVLIHFPDKSHSYTGRKITVLFHKRVHGAINLSDSNSVPKIANAINEIEELIF
jgi:riboflavin kinase/FMN adenylyltransferase